MGVYQSATEPVIRKRQFSMLITSYERDILNGSSKKKKSELLRYVRKTYNIPSRVVPVEWSDKDGVARLDWSWFEVETFNR